MLAQAAAAGTPFSSATITMNDSSGPKIFSFNNVLIASYNAGSQQGDSAPMEQMDWNFTQMTANLSPYDNSSSGGVCTMVGSLDQNDGDDGANSSSL